MNSGSQIEIRSLDKHSLKVIFELVAKNSQGKITGRIDKEKLRDLFKLIDYDVSEEHFQQIYNKLFQNGQKQEIDFNEFTQIFFLKLESYSVNDIKNAFRLIAKNNDKVIPVKKILKMFEKQGISQEEANELIQQLEEFKDDEDNINYNDFLKSFQT